MSVWDLQCGESTRHTLCFFSHLRALTLPNLMQKRGHEEEHSRLFCADVLMVTWSLLPAFQSLLPKSSLFRFLGFVFQIAVLDIRIVPKALRRCRFRSKLS